MDSRMGTFGFIRNSSGLCEPHSDECGRRENESVTFPPMMEEHTPTRADVYAVYPQQLHLSARARSLIDFLIERFKHIDNIVDRDSSQ